MIYKVKFCEIKVDGYSKRKDFYVKTVNDDFNFFETLNSITPVILDLNYESEYRFIGGDDNVNLVNHPFKIGVYPDTNQTDILRLIELSDNTLTVSSDGLHTMPENKKFINSSKADDLTSMTNTAINTLEWYDNNGNLLPNESGSSISILGTDTENNPNRITIKLKYKPTNYLGHKTTSRLFYRSGQQLENNINGQILINTPHNVVKLFDYSLLDNKYEQPLFDQDTTSYYPNDNPSEIPNFNSIIQPVTSSFNNSISLLEYDNAHGTNVRNEFINSIERLERLMVYSEDYLNNRKEEIDNNTIFSTDNDYTNTKVSLFNDKNIWKGMTMYKFGTYKHENSTQDPVAAARYRGGKGNNFDVLINHGYYNDYDLPVKQDTLTHELIHGIGVVPVRGAKIVKETTRNEIPFSQPPLPNDYELPFYPGSIYPELGAKYKEYTDSQNWFDWSTQRPGVINDVNNNQDGSKIPLEDEGGSGTNGSHFERNGYFNDNSSVGSNTQYYLGIGNELMNGSIIPSKPYGVISGLTIAAAKSIKESGNINVFKTSRDDGEVVPPNATEEERNTIPWHKWPSENITGVSKLQLANSNNELIYQRLHFNVPSSYTFQILRNVEIEQPNHRCFCPH
jgi:hypothetical protein